MRNNRKTFHLPHISVCTKSTYWNNTLIQLNFSWALWQSLCRIFVVPKHIQCGKLKVSRLFDKLNWPMSRSRWNLDPFWRCKTRITLFSIRWFLFEMHVRAFEVRRNLKPWLNCSQPDAFVSIEWKRTKMCGNFQRKMSKWKFYDSSKKKKSVLFITKKFSHSLWKRFYFIILTKWNYVQFLVVICKVKWNVLKFLIECKLNFDTLQDGFGHHVLIGN
jgi:hypothetical protein